MSPGAFVVPPLGNEAIPANAIASTRHVLRFLSEVMSGYNNEIPFSADAMFGFSLILDGLIAGLDKTEASGINL
jgi:hypothetical protein